MQTKNNLSLKPKVLILTTFLMCSLQMFAQVTPKVEMSSMFDIPRNSVSLESNLIITLDTKYERLLPVKDHFGVILGGGYTMGVGFGYGLHLLNAETLLVFGGPKHMFETGVVAFVDIDADGNSGPGFKAGYRFQGKKGLLLKANIILITFEDPPVIPMIGLGYSF